MVDCLLLFNYFKENKNETLYMPVEFNCQDID